MSYPNRIHMKSFLALAILLLSSALSAQIRTGAEQTDRLVRIIGKKRVTLTVNQTSLCGEIHLADTLMQRGVNIVQLFAPEHGIRGQADAGEKIHDGHDVRTGLSIVSLYGKNKKPQPGQLEKTDAVVFDLQDVGARFFTYISTLYYVMQACAENGKEVIVLDRPNPCDYVDGPVLDLKHRSFVGMLPIPLLHGCTMGELARMINGEGWLGEGKRCRLTVIPVEGWKHGQAYSLPVKPSPNLPDDLSIAFYPSLCPFEGTSVSVGRGTQFPFRVIGSPYLIHSPTSSGLRQKSASQRKDMPGHRPSETNRSKRFQSVVSPSVLPFLPESRMRRQILFPSPMVRFADGYRTGTFGHSERKDRR